MKPSCWFLGVTAGFCLPAARAADATTPVDYTQRNGQFAPAATITPEKKILQQDSAIQDKRVEKKLFDRASSPLGDKRAPLELKETREKQIQEKNSQRPAAVEQPFSSMNHREAVISTSADTRKPPIVAKYQDSLTAASAANMARFPALDQATGARINRFVFRKNGADSAAITTGATVTPAAGGGSVQK